MLVGRLGVEEVAVVAGAFVWRTEGRVGFADGNEFCARVGGVVYVWMVGFREGVKFPGEVLASAVGSGLLEVAMRRC